MKKFFAIAVVLAVSVGLMLGCSNKIRGPYETNPPELSKGEFLLTEEITLGMGYADVPEDWNDSSISIDLETKNVDYHEYRFLVTIDGLSNFGEVKSIAATPSTGNAQEPSEEEVLSWLSEKYGDYTQDGENGKTNYSWWAENVRLDLNVNEDSKIALRMYYFSPTINFIRLSEDDACDQFNRLVFKHKIPGEEMLNIRIHEKTLSVATTLSAYSEGRHKDTNTEAIAKRLDMITSSILSYPEFDTYWDAISVTISHTYSGKIDHTYGVYSVNGDKISRIKAGNRVIASNDFEYMSLE